MYLPRLLIAVVSVPLAFVACAFAAARFGFAPETPADAAGAVTFALVILAPSTRNAAARAGVAVALTAIACAISLVAR